MKIYSRIEIPFRLRITEPQDIRYILFAKLHQGVFRVLIDSFCFILDHHNNSESTLTQK